MKKASIVFFQVDYARLISALDWVKNGVRPRCPTVVCVQVSISVFFQPTTRRNIGRFYVVG